MNVTIEDMKLRIQEWYAHALNYEQLFEIHYAVMSEANKQSVLTARAIAEECADNE